MTLKLHRTPVTSFQQNSCILWDDVSKACILTDVGGEVDALAAYIEENQLIPQAIWLTHGHFDHIQAVPEFIAKYPIDVLGSNQKDNFLFEMLPKTLAMYGLPSKPAFVPTRWLKEGDSLNVGPYQFEVLEIPGHTPGHIVFYSKKLALLIAGDVLFRESIGRTDLPGGNYDDLITNIKEKLWLLPDETTVITGHGPFTTIGYEKQHNPFLG